MTSSIKNASARQHSGRPSTTPYRGGDRSNRRRSADIANVEREIAELVDRSTQDLRVGWRQLHRTKPPPGLSRDLIIRSPRASPARGKLWRGEPGAAAPPAEPVCGVRERRPMPRFQDRSEGRRDVGASVARARLHRAGSRRRVRIRRPALPLFDRDRRADHRGALVGSAFFGLAKHAQVLWSEPRPADDEVSRHSTRRNARVR